jgi:hypothetical protein
VKSANANHNLSRVSVSVDETILVPNAELPPAVLTQRLGLAGLVDSRRPHPDEVAARLLPAAAKRQQHDQKWMRA